jgi:hypothetical protein
MHLSGEQHNQFAFLPLEEDRKRRASGVAQCRGTKFVERSMKFTFGEIVLLIAFLIAIGLSLLHVVMTWMEKKGWIYYRKNKPTGVMRSVFSGFDEFMRPEIRHVQEDKRQREAEKSDQDPTTR